MTDDMVERVAKAVANAYFKEDCWDSLTEEVYDEFLVVARAAIEEMLEPTEEMLDAVALEGHATERNAHKTLFRAMMTAALSRSST